MSQRFGVNSWELLSKRGLAIQAENIVIFWIWLQQGWAKNSLTISLIWKLFIFWIKNSEVIQIQLYPLVLWFVLLFYSRTNLIGLKRRWTVLLCLILFAPIPMYLWMGFSVLSDYKLSRYSCVSPLLIIIKSHQVFSLTFFKDRRKNLTYFSHTFHCLISLLHLSLRSYFFHHIGSPIKCSF